MSKIKMESVTHAMDKDHKRIKELLASFEEAINAESEKAEETFQRFKWNLEKHFFVEEKIIFNSFEPESEEEKEDLSRILNEHIKILNLIERAEDSFLDNKKPDVEEIKKSLLAHAKFEDEVFYQKLDETLSQEQKQEIINKAKEIIID